MDNHIKLFDKIAFIYQWFFNRQIKSYQKLIEENEKYLNISRGDKVLDIGCGTGAFAYSLQSNGYEVIGIDASLAMVKQGLENNVDCLHKNVVTGLDFPDNSFDLVTAAYVAHGLDKSNRLKLYKEARRLTRDRVIFHDYNQKRRFIFSLINIIEYFEGGNYFSFRENAVSEMKKVFTSVEVVDTGLWNCWYICQ